MTASSGHSNKRTGRPDGTIPALNKPYKRKSPGENSPCKTLPQAWPLQIFLPSSRPGSRPFPNRIPLGLYTPACSRGQCGGKRSFIQRNNGFWQKQCPAISAGYLARPSQHHPGTGIGAVATPLPSLSEFPSPSGLHKQTPGWIPGNLPGKRDSGQMTGKRSGMVSKA